MPAMITSGSPVPMASALTSHRRATSADIAALLAPGPSWRFAMTQSDSPGRDCVEAGLAGPRRGCLDGDGLPGGCGRVGCRGLHRRRDFVVRGWRCVRRSVGRRPREQRQTLGCLAVCRAGFGPKGLDVWRRRRCLPCSARGRNRFDVEASRERRSLRRFTDRADRGVINRSGRSGTWLAPLRPRDIEIAPRLAFDRTGLIRVAGKRAARRRTGIERKCRVATGIERRLAGLGADSLPRRRGALLGVVGLSGHRGSREEAGEANEGTGDELAAACGPTDGWDVAS